MRDLESHFEDKFLQDAGIVAKDGQLCVAEDYEAEYLDQIRVG